MLSRGDLVNPDNDYPVDLLPSCFGGLDSKVINAALMKLMQFWVIVGPTKSNTTPAFSFSATAALNITASNGTILCNNQDYPVGQKIDNWDFDWNLTTWPIPSFNGVPNDD